MGALLNLALRVRAYTTPYELSLDSQVALFEFASTSGTPVDTVESLEERAGIIAEGRAIDHTSALKEAQRHIHREMRWRLFLRNANRVLRAPDRDRAELIARYQCEAANQYGVDAARGMTESLKLWVFARGVH